MENKLIKKGIVMAKTRLDAIDETYSECYSCALKMYQNFVGSNEETKNMVKFIDGNVVTVSIDEKSNRSAINPCLISEITDVQKIEKDGNAKIIKITFADGTSEKAVLSNEDVFSLEQGISICITKKLLSDRTYGHGSSVYNKLIKHGLKVYENAEIEKTHMLAEKDAQEQRFSKLLKKKEEKKAKREAAMREREISIQAEAYLRAMREFNSTSDESAE